MALQTAIAGIGAVPTYLSQVDRLLIDNKKLREENAALLVEVGKLREQLRQREAARLSKAA